jgi:hypothetical protein
VGTVARVVVLRMAVSSERVESRCIALRIDDISRSGKVKMYREQQGNVGDQTKASTSYDLAGKPSRDKANQQNYEQTFT